MKFERTPFGIVIGEQYLPAQEALQLLHWLTAQQAELKRLSREQVGSPIKHEPSTDLQPCSEWSQADEEEMRSEDEQIARLEL